MKNHTTYLQVGKAIGLSPDTLVRYVQYMERRWAKEETLQCKTGYAEEWAERFQNGCEYNCSDSTGRAILDQLKSDEDKEI